MGLWKMFHQGSQHWKSVFNLQEVKICVDLFLAASGLGCSMGDPHCGAGVQFKAPELVGSWGLVASRQVES